jgi:hypothetical protein
MKGSAPMRCRPPVLILILLVEELMFAVTARALPDTDGPTIALDSVRGYLHLAMLAVPAAFDRDLTPRRRVKKSKRPKDSSTSQSRQKLHPPFPSFKKCTTPLTFFLNTPIR